MMSPLEDKLLQFYASVADREKGAAHIDENQAYFQKLFSLACSPKKERKHIVAAWVLEKFTLEKLALLTPMLSSFLTSLILGGSPCLGTIDNDIFGSQYTLDNSFSTNI